MIRFRPLQRSNSQNDGFCRCGEMKEFLSVFLLERMHENMVLGLEEYAEGIYGMLKMKVKTRRDFNPYKVKRSAGLHQLHGKEETAKQLKVHGQEKESLPHLGTEASG